jgi:Nuclease A inhibitor-like protein
MDRTENIAQKLTEATDGLLFSSEGEYPFSPIVWRGQAKEDFSSADLLAISVHPEGTPVQVTDVDTFFRRAVKEQDWHGETEKVNVKKFMQLVEHLKNNLENLQVFKVGEYELEVYVLGKVDLDMVGLSTKVVQT